MPLIRFRLRKLSRNPMTRSLKRCRIDITPCIRITSFESFLANRHLTTRPSNNVYTRAAAYLKEWRASGVLEQLPAPAFFVYYQRFTVPGTNEVRVRKGFVGAGQLEEYRNKVVFPHERTLTGPKKDRQELLRHTRTQFEQIFMLYEDPEQQIDKKLDEIARQKPDIQIDDEYGVQHTVWIVSDPQTVGVHSAADG